MSKDQYVRITSACYVEDDLCSNPSVDHSISDLISVRLSRRAVIQAATCALATRLLGESGLQVAGSGLVLRTGLRGGFRLDHG